MASVAGRDTASAPRFLTTRQSAARLGVSVNALKAWIRQARLPALRTPGGHHRIAEGDLLAFKARLTVGTRRGRRGRAPRILLVDDDRGVLALLSDALATGLPGARVEVAADGYEALFEVGAFHPDLLVLDLRMPGLDGLEVCERIKGRPHTREIRILAVTGYPEDGLRARVRAAGAEDYMEKPLNLAEFLRRVAALLGLAARRRWP